eukprot:239884-Chlamydomonas_euryale.AAC.1
MAGGSAQISLVCAAAERGAFKFGARGTCGVGAAGSPGVRCSAATPAGQRRNTCWTALQHPLLPPPHTHTHSALTSP